MIGDGEDAAISGRCLQSHSKGVESHAHTVLYTGPLVETVAMLISCGQLLLLLLAVIC